MAILRVPTNNPLAYHRTLRVLQINPTFKFHFNNISDIFQAVLHRFNIAEALFQCQDSTYMRNLWNTKWLRGQVFVRELRFDSSIII
jgi:hypothetical protein